MVNVTYDECEYRVHPLRSAPRRAHATSPAGSLVWFDPDAQENVVYDLGDIAWVLASTALVWIMIPGIGFFYSGLLRRKNALSMIWLSVVVLSVVSFQVRASPNVPRSSADFSDPISSGSFGVSR